MHKHIKVKTAKNRKQGSTKWLSRQLNDPYKHQAEIDGYKSRAAYKLLEINDKFGVLNQAVSVLDLGSSPGGWSQVAAKYCKKVVALDLLPMAKIDNVEFIQCDFTKVEPGFFSNKFDVMLSDMSPSTCGHQATDHLRIISLVQEVFEASQDLLDVSGSVVTKIFHGEETQNLCSALKRKFKMVKYYKPLASRKNSNEIYLIAKHKL